MHDREDRLIEVRTDTDPGAMMQLVRLWDQNVGKNFAEMMFAATTRRMGPVED